MTLYVYIVHTFLRPSTLFIIWFAPVAVYFEQEEWELCIKTCEEVVEKGRDARADYKVISKYVKGERECHYSYV